MLSREGVNELSGQLLDACMEVHRHLGPGLLESVYHAALMIELEMRSIAFTSEYEMEVIYKGRRTGKIFKADLLVEDEIILELKAVPSHRQNLQSRPACRR